MIVRYLAFKIVFIITSLYWKIESVSFSFVFFEISEINHCYRNYHLHYRYSLMCYERSNGVYLFEKETNKNGEVHRIVIDVRSKQLVLHLFVLQKKVIHHHYLEWMDQHPIQATVSYKKYDWNEQL